MKPYSENQRRLIANGPKRWNRGDYIAACIAAARRAILTNRPVFIAATAYGWALTASREETTPSALRAVFTPDGWENL